MKTINKYVVISRQDCSEVHLKKTVGRNVLMSCAQKPIWCTFYWLKIRKQKLPEYFDESLANYAIKKYANTKDYEVMTLAEANILFKKYKY